MGRNSNQTGGQKEAKYKAKASNSHDHYSHADMASKPCLACSGAHRAHTCAKKGPLKKTPTWWRPHQPVVSRRGCDTE